MIDERAIIDPTAVLESGVTVGPWSIIGPKVTIGAGTVIGPHVVINGPTKIGKNNRIYQFASVGEDPQDLKFKKTDEVFLEIGDNNVIREFCTVNRGTLNGGGVTRVGHHNLLMAYVHIAHDCTVGNHTVFANTVNIAGHVSVGDYAIIGGSAVIAQFCRIGAYSFVCGFSTIVKDIPPFVLVDGRPAKPVNLNMVGLKRNNFSSELVKGLKQAYKIFYRSDLSFEEAKLSLKDLAVSNELVARFLTFIEGVSKPGVIR